MRTVIRVDRPDAYADDRQAVGIAIVAPKRFAPDLAASVESRWPHGRLMIQHLPRFRDPVIFPARDRSIRKFLLPAGNGCAAAGENHSGDARLARALKH